MIASPDLQPEQANMSQEEMASALFAQMIMQQTNMAMMLLGQVPHPKTGETLKDLEAARMFIDQLEMLEVKTKGNLSKPEEHFLKQSLLSLHMAFVEAAKLPVPENPQPTAPAQSAEDQPAENHGGATEEEAKRKFSKKY